MEDKFKWEWKGFLKTVVPLWWLAGLIFLVLVSYVWGLTSQKPETQKSSISIEY